MVRRENRFGALSSHFVPFSFLISKWMMGSLNLIISWWCAMWFSVPKCFFSLRSSFLPLSLSVFFVCYKPFYQAGTLDNDVTCDGCIIGHMHRRLDVSVLEPNTCIDVKWRECNFHLIACVLVVAVVVVHRLLRASVLCRLRRRKKKSHITKFTCHEYNYDDDRWENFVVRRSRRHPSSIENCIRSRFSFRFIFKFRSPMKLSSWESWLCLYQRSARVTWIACN